MKKSELEKELFVKAVQVVKRFDPVELNADILGKKATEYSYTVRFRLPGAALSEERDISIVVFNEGTDEEEALYGHGVLPDNRSDLEIMVSLANQIDPNAIVLDSPAQGVWKVELSNGAIKLVALNSARNGLINIETK